MIKRWTSAMLALLLVLLGTLGGFSPVLAEDEDGEVYAAPAEEEVGLTADPGSEDLLLVLDEWETDDAPTLIAVDPDGQAAVDDTSTVDPENAQADETVLIDTDEIGFIDAEAGADADVPPQENPAEGGEPNDPAEGEGEPDNGVFTLNAMSTEVVVAASYQLEAFDAENGETIDPDELSFETSDEAVATVSDEGVVTAIQPGEVDISVTYHDEVLRSAVTVPQEPSDVSLNYTSGTIGLSEEYSNLQVTMLPKDSNASVTWRSSNSKYVKVVASDGGKVTIKGVKTGSAYIYAKTRNGIEKKCKVTVKNAPKSVSIGSIRTVGVSQTRSNPGVKFPSGSFSANLVWKSSDPAIASVDAATGKITGHKVGKVTVTARTYNGKTSNKCTVTVKPAPASIAYPKAGYTFSKGYTRHPVPVYEPSNAMTTCTYTSSDPSVATVDATGVVKGKGLGTATITCETYNGKTASCEVTVMKPATSLKLSKTAATLGVGRVYTLTATLAPMNAADPNDIFTNADPRVVWWSSKSSVVSVSGGTLTALKVGTATITAQTPSGKKATCKIYVKKAPTSVSFDRTSLVLGAGGMRFSLTRSFKPADASPGLVYASSDSDVVEIEQVKDGIVSLIAHNAGNAVISATAYNGLRTECAVTVLPPPASISFKENTHEIAVYQSFTPEITMSAAGGGATEATLTYSVVSETVPGCVSVGKTSGKITGKKDGQATISVTTHNGVTAANLTVTVNNSSIIEAVIAKAKSALGKKYVYGGGYKTANPTGFDCSGLTYWAYYYGTGKKVTLGNSAYKQGNDSAYANKRVTGWKNCVRGDILCFKSDTSSTISHVGLYLGSGTFIHASSSGKKVQYGYFNSGNSADYWKRNLVWGYHVF